MKIKKLLSKENVAFYLFLSPFILFFLCFMLYPIIYSFYMSLHKWGGLGIPQFISFKNYIWLTGDKIFWKTIWNTVYLWLVSTPLTLGLALILAVILNRKETRFLGIFRVGYFLPFVTSTVVVGIVFSLILNYDFGFINYILKSLGFIKIPFLNSVDWSKNSIVMLIIWRWVGYNTIIMLAGLQNIDLSLYEAAEIDGASKLQQFLKITIPLMRPILLFTFILSTIGSFKLFTEPYILTSGGPRNSSLTTVMYLYSKGFEQFRMGYASAISYVLFFIIFILSMIQLKVGSKKGGI